MDTSFFQQSGFKKYLKNTSWMFFGKVVDVIINFIVGIYIARYLGPSGYGMLGYIMSFCGLFLSFAGLGIDSLIIKGLNYEPDKTNAWLGTGFILRVWGAIMAVGLTVIAAILFHNNNLNVAFVAAYSFFVVFQIFNVIDFYFQATLKVEYSTYSYIIASIIASLFKILFIVLHRDVGYFLAAYTIESLLTAIAMIVFYQRNSGNIQQWKFDKSISNYLIKSCWPFILSLIATAIYFRIDQVLLGYFTNDATVGIYAIAAKFSEIWSLIPSIVCASLFPAIVNSYKTDSVIFGKRMSQLYALMFYLSVSISLLVTFNAHWVIPLLFGAAYLGSISILKIYVWSILGMFINIALQQYLIVSHELKTLLALNVIGMVTNVGLNLIFIPRFGAPAAALVNVVSYLIPVIVIFLLPRIRQQGRLLIKGVMFNA